MNTTLAAPKLVVVADDIRDWAATLERVVATECFPGSDIEFRRATDAVGARAEIERARTDGIEPALLVDLHMDRSGSHPERNGDALISELAVTRLPPLAVVSGTVAGSRRADLGATIGGIPFAQKDALLPDASPAARLIAVERLKAALSGEPPRVTAAELSALRELAASGIEPARGAVLVEEAKARIGALIDSYPGAIRACPMLGELIPHGLHQGDVIGNVHDFKNVLAMAVERLKGTSVGNGLPAALVTELAVHQGWLNQSYLQERLGLKTTLAPDVVRSVASQLAAIAGEERLQVRIFSPSLEVFVPAGDVSMVVGSILGNALLHGNGLVRVRVEDDTITVINTVPDGVELPFRISGNSFYGDAPQGSTLATGSGTGLRSLVERLKSMDSIRLDVWQEGRDVFATMSFYHDSIVKRTEPDEAAGETLDVALQRPNVLFLCHDNAAQTTFSKTLAIPIAGANFVPLQTPPNFDNPYAREDGVAAIATMFQENAAAFENATLALVHMGVGGFSSILPQLAERYPHLLVVPTSTEPYHWYHAETERFLDRVEERLGRNIFSMRTVRQFIRPDDPSSVSEVASEIHRVSLSRPVWETMLLVAKRAAEAVGTSRVGTDEL